MNLISCKDLVIGYEGNIAVKDVGFEIEKGDYLCIVGENGSGKSTLIKGMLGLIKTIGGKIQFNNIKQSDIGYLPQQTIVQRDFPATVFEVVLSGCLNQNKIIPFYSKKDKERANYNINTLDLENLKKKSYRDLSGGQQQRVLLARALCATEDLILLDEPVSGLDPVMTSHMYNLISELNSKCGITVIMVSHDMNSAVQYGNKILHLHTSPIFFGTTDEYVKTNMYNKMIGVVNND